MKFIKNRKYFLNEAKIKEYTFKKQSDVITEMWGKQYLEYEEVEPTEKIKHGKWKLSDEDKFVVLNSFFNCDIKKLQDELSALPDKFVEVLSMSIDEELIKDSYNEKYPIIKDIDIKHPKLSQLSILHYNLFKNLASETTASEMVKKDENGRPIRDEQGNIIKISKNPGDPVYSNNLVSINTFVTGYNRFYPNERVEMDFTSTEFSNLRSIMGDLPNTEYDADLEIFDKDIYLYITHNPKDILNMSISRFYASCQDLYKGGYRDQVLGNVFDPNSSPAFLIFETPIYVDGEIISEFLPLSRIVVRNIDSMEENDDKDAKIIFFDRAYPDRMKPTFDEIIRKYSKNINNYEGRYYYWSPDIDMDDYDTVKSPYMDKLSKSTVKTIGKNVKKLFISQIYNDWKSIKILPNNNIEEIIIDNVNIPNDLLKLNFKLKYIKFKYLDLINLGVFNNINYNNISFEKCILESDSLSNVISDVKNLQIISCEVKNGYLNLSKLQNIEELQLLYTIDTPEELSKFIENLNNIKKIILSGDLKRKEFTNIFNELRRKKIKIEFIGPII